MQDLHSGTITRAYCRAIYEESVSRCFILPSACGGRITRAYCSTTYEWNKIDNQHESKEL